MASPFAVFRKNQKVMMAILAVFAMIAFVFLDPLSMGFGPGGSGGSNEVVARSRYGSIRKSDVDRLLMQRQLVKQFVAQLLFRNAVKQYGEQMAMFLANNIEQQLEMAFGPNTERSVIETSILADQAREQGVVIGDDFVKSFLNGIGGSSLTPTEISSIMAGLGSQRYQLTWPELYDAVRQELLAQRIRGQFEDALQITPAQRWEFYQQLNGRATIEALAVPVSQFVAQVPDPSPRVLESFYNEFKDRIPQPGSPDPGFKIPQRASFQYFVAPFERFVDPTAVSSEEVQEYYDKNKGSEFPFSRSHLTDDTAEPATTGGELPAATPEADPPAGKLPGTEATPPSTTPNDPEAATPKSPDKTPSPPASPADSAPPASTSPPADATPPATSEPTTLPADATPPTADPNDDCGADEPADPPANEPANTEPANTEPAAVTESAGTASEPPATAPAASSESEPAVPITTEPPAAVTDESPPATPSLGAPTGQPLDEPPTTSQPAVTHPPLPTDWPYRLPTDVLDGPDPPHDPFWKVENAIRTRLARQKAEERIRALFTELRDAMSDHAGRIVAEQTSRPPDGSPVKYPPLDMRPLAEPRGMGFDTTPLLSPYELSQSEGFGTSQITGQGPVADDAFRRLRPLQIMQSVDSDNNHYLFWKIEDHPTRVPPLDEIRSDVVRAWKMREARQLALQRARELAAEAEKSAGSLVETFADQEDLRVITPPAFSWLTTGTLGAIDRNVPPRLSDVPGVEDPGPDFMRAVFDLDVGQVTTAMNNPQTVAYVVRLKNLQPTRFQLREGYLADRRGSFFPAYGLWRNEVNDQWMAARNQAAGLVWVTPPTDADDR